MDTGTFLGVDIGKSGHYALAVDGTGKVIHQTAVVNDEAALRKLVVWAKEHQATLVVDQPGGAAALLLRRCWQSEVRIGYLHGLAMARAREFYAGESKNPIDLLCPARAVAEPRDHVLILRMPSCAPTWRARIPAGWCG